MSGLHPEQILPAELWLRCFQFLTPLELCFSVAPTCRLFSKLASDNALWSHFVHPSWRLGQSPIPPADEVGEHQQPGLFRTRQKHSPSRKPLSTPQYNMWKSLWLAWIRYQARRYHQEQHAALPPKSQSLSGSFDYLFKYKLVGDSGVGKSCLLLRCVITFFPLGDDHE